MRKSGNRPVYILTTQEQIPGGITNFYDSFKIFSTHSFEYLGRGRRFGEQNSLFSIPRLIGDYYKFIRKIYRSRGLILINTVLDTKPFFRDSLYALLSSRQQKKIVFWLGWNPAFEDRMEQSFFLRKWMHATFFKCDHMIVLSSDCKEKLRSWGFDREISVETTMVDDRLLENSSLENFYRVREKARDNTGRFNILYLGNIANEKGVGDVIRSFHYMTSHHSDKKLSYTIVGSGKDLESLKKYAGDHNITVDLPGYVSVDDKAEAFKKAQIYLFASKHEGMPISVLEAMAFGLPVLTTRVGGIPDFFEEGKMGFLLDHTEPKYISEKILYLIERPELMKQIGAYNYRYAKKHFYASNVSKRLDSIIAGV